MGKPPPVIRVRRIRVRRIWDRDERIVFTVAVVLVVALIVTIVAGSF